jgi:hypothetical protein
LFYGTGGGLLFEELTFFRLCFIGIFFVGCFCFLFEGSAFFGWCRRSFLRIVVETWGGFFLSRGGRSLFVVGVVLWSGCVGFGGIRCFFGGIGLSVHACIGMLFGIERGRACIGRELGGGERTRVGCRTRRGGLSGRIGCTRERGRRGVAGRGGEEAWLEPPKAKRGGSAKKEEEEQGEPDGRACTGFLLEEIFDHAVGCGVLGEGMEEEAVAIVELLLCKTLIES